MNIAQSWMTLQHYGLYSPWNSPGQNTGMGSSSLLQGIFPTSWATREALIYFRTALEVTHLYRTSLQVVENSLYVLHVWLLSWTNTNWALVSTNTSEYMDIEKERFLPLFFHVTVDFRSDYFRTRALIPGVHGIRPQGMLLWWGALTMSKQNLNFLTISLMWDF